MASVRKSIKVAKRQLKELRAEDVPQDGSIRVIAMLFANDWKIATVPSVPETRSTARMKAFKRRNERKIKKQGKWAEYREFRAYQKHIQATQLPLWLIDPPTMSYKKFRELWDKGRTWNNKQDEQRQAIFRPFDA